VVGDILQPSHLLFVLVIALLVLGPKRLPEVGKTLGKGLRDFRMALREHDPREDLAQLHEESMGPIQTAPPPETVVAPPPQVPEPVATGAPAPQGPAAEQYESD
jgi:sec-independent protein translocase protein TatA